MDTGHAKNVANFETALLVLTELGAEYAPNQELISIRELQPELAAAKAALADIDTAQASKTVAVDAVQAQFKDLDKFSVNIKRSAEVELNDPAFTQDLQAIVNKFSPPGRNTGLPDDPLTAEDESRTTQSQSQRSRDSQIAHLADISALLKTRTDYAPTDETYKVATIDARITSLTSANNAAKTAIAAIGNKLDARDAVLYNDETGIIPRIKLIKTYLALKFGKDSAAYRQINALEFRRVK